MPGTRLIWQGSWPETDARTYRRYLPYVGMVTIIMNDYPYVKYLVIGVLALFVITGKD